MIHKIFTVYDAKAEAYLRPFFLPTKGLAIRGFTDAVNDPGHQFHQHPEDYTLFEIGEWDDSNAVFIAGKVHTPLGKAIEFLAKAERIDGPTERDETPVQSGANGGGSPELVREEPRAQDDV